MVAAVTEKVSQLGAEVSSSATPDEKVSQLGAEVGMTTTAQTTLMSQFPVEAGWNATSLNTTYFSQVAVEVAVRGRPIQREMRAWTFNLDGHSFYLLHAGDDVGTLVYDQTTGLWSQWQSVTDIPNAPFRGRCGTNWGTDIIVGDDNFGLLWNIVDNVYQDEPPNSGYANTAINAITTGGIPQHIRNSTQCNGVMIRFSAGSAPTGTTLKLETSDDQGNTYDDQGTVTMDTNTQQQVQWLSLGSISQPLRVFKFTDTGIPRIDGADMW